MAIIHVPRPPKLAINPQRTASSLLKTQIEHLQQAELRLPLKYQTGTYVNAIKTEGEAADYIGAVTKAIHDAHVEAARNRAKVSRRRGRILQIAAAAAPKSARKRQSTAKRKKKTRIKPKSRRKK
ncbi:MAG TPA: hypothetical protein VH596_13940 [Terriglobales bacterium]|jgi:hypothetical protein